MRASQHAKADIAITDEQVAEFLLEHRDFLLRHPDVLEDLELPHDSGGAVSLVERQVAVMRERNIEMRQRLGKLVDTARDNDRLFNLTRRLALDLMRADSLAGVSEALNSSLQKDFKADFHTLWILTDEPLTDTTASGENYRCVSPVEAKQSIGHLISADQVICGVLRKEETNFLFPDCADRIQSAAVVPIGATSKTALLAVGSPNPQHFKSGMGTLFLSYIGEILSNALPKYL